MKYTLTNATPSPVSVDLIQNGLWGDSKVVEESQKSERRDANSVEWTVVVPANGSTDVTATFDSKY